MRPSPQAHKIRAVRGEGVPVPRSLLVIHANELLTLRGPRGPRIREAASELGIVPDGAVYVEGDLDAFAARLGDALDAVIQGKYYFGGPVAEAPVRWTAWAMPFIR